MAEREHHSKRARYIGEKAIIDDDLVEVRYKNSKREDTTLVLAWGDPIKVLSEDLTEIVFNSANTYKASVCQ